MAGFWTNGILEFEKLLRAEYEDKLRDLDNALRQTKDVCDRQHLLSRRKELQRELRKRLNEINEMLF